MSAGSTQSGLRLLRAAIVLAIGLAVGMCIWIVDKAISNPDVTTKRPGWLEEAIGFETSFWIPLFLTVAVGMGLVLYVFVCAYRRISAGDDLFENRFGKRVRRRGERFVADEDEHPSNFDEPVVS